MKTVAGIDLGTQSMKVVLYDYETRKSLESSSCPMELISESDGTREQKTEWYKKGLEVCFSKISSEGKKSIQAIGVSGQQHGFVPLDSEGNPLYNIKLWNDTSTAKECELITNAAGGQNEVVKEVQNFILPGYFSNREGQDYGGTEALYSQRTGHALGGRNSSGKRIFGCNGLRSYLKREDSAE